MNNIIVKRGQSLLDIAIIYCGNVSYCVEIARLNNMTVSAVLKIGEVLIIPKISNNTIVGLFSEKNQSATKLNELIIAVKPISGIGYWQIGENFEVQ